MAYSESAFDEREVTEVDALRALPRDVRTWVDVQGLGNEALLREIGGTFGLHPLALEDVVHIPGRPKVEAYDDHLLIITRMVRPDAEDIVTEQVSLVVGRHFVLSFQETYGDVLDPVRNRLRSGLGQIRRLGADYLAYAIWDTIIDAYHPLAEHLGDVLDRLEDQILARPAPAIPLRLNDVRGDLLALRRSIVPQRDAVRSLLREETPFVSREVRVYLRDVHDHCVQSAEAIDAAREMANNLMGLYLSFEGHRTNEIMKVLTLVASIFVPLTFLAGVYGMNFKHMPEIGVWWSYPAVLLVMGAVVLGMVGYFRRKGWIGNPPDDA